MTTEVPRPAYPSCLCGSRWWLNKAICLDDQGVVISWCGSLICYECGSPHPFFGGSTWENRREL
jgi:hypothetical protein